MCARGAAEAARRRRRAGARNEASLRRGRWRRGGKGCSYVFNVIRNSRCAQASCCTSARRTSDRDADTDTPGSILAHGGHTLRWLLRGPKDGREAVARDLPLPIRLAQQEQLLI